MDQPSPTAVPVPAAYHRYSEKRRELFYYRYIDAIVPRFAAEARSIIDVGSYNVSLLEQYDWIPHRTSLDLLKPYRSAKVEGIQMDFFAFEPRTPYDFALCLQVLEHIPDAERFARKLLAVATNVLISVPYKWRAGACVHHCQDPVDMAKLTGWFGRKPDYFIVVEEPMHKKSSRRLIAYFHGAETAFNLKALRNKQPPGPAA